MRINHVSQKFLSVMVFSLMAGVVGTLSARDAAAQVRSAYTSDVDEPARAPYQASVRQFCFTSNKECDFTFSAAPAGKRLVVTNASGYFGSSSSFQYIFVAMRKGTESDVFLPTSNQGCGGGSTPDLTCPNSIYVFNQAVQVFYNDGQQPVVRISTGSKAYPILNGANSALPFYNTVTLSGYLVDCVAVICQPIVP